MDLTLIENYYNLGWQIMPLKPGTKLPTLTKWKDLQSVRSELSRVLDYFFQNQQANLAIITGRLSNLTVLDIDTSGKQAEDFALNFQTPTVKTPKGYHVYFKYSGLRNAAGIEMNKLKLDLRSEGGYVVAPPSQVSGKNYHWLLPPTFPIKDFPTTLIPYFEMKRSTSLNSERWEHIINSTEEGERNMNAASLIGKLLHHLPPKDWGAVAWPLVKSWNDFYVTPPLEESELFRTFESIGKRQLLERQEHEDKSLDS